MMEMNAGDLLPDLVADLSGQDGPVNLTIPKGATTGQKLRLRGRGIKGGDQQVELKIVMPPKVDHELEAFMESWRKSHDYDPRAGMNYGSGT